MADKTIIRFRIVLGFVCGYSLIQTLVSCNESVFGETRLEPLIYHHYSVESISIFILPRRVPGED